MQKHRQRDDRLVLLEKNKKSKYESVRTFLCFKIETSNYEDNPALNFLYNLGH